ncbi:hypothetical protein MRX96_008513 [Rhipicephalus microplus]
MNEQCLRLTDGERQSNTVQECVNRVDGYLEGLQKGCPVATGAAGKKREFISVNRHMHFTRRDARDVVGQLGQSQIEQKKGINMLPWVR